MNMSIGRMALAIKLLRSNHHLDGIGDQVSDGPSFSDTIADEGSGDVEQRRAYGSDVGMRTER